MQAANDLANSPSSDASLIRGVACTSVNSSSRTSLRSFHFEEASPALRDDGSFGTMSTGSAIVRGSGGANSRRQTSGSDHNYGQRDNAHTLVPHRRLFLLRRPRRGLLLPSPVLA